MKKLFELWPGEENFAAICKGIRKAEDYRASVTGLHGSASAFFIAALAGHAGLPALVVTADSDRAEQFFLDLQHFSPGQVHLLPAREFCIGDDIVSRSGEYSEQRMHFFDWLHEGKEGIYVASLAALLTRVLPFYVWKNLILELRQGQNIDRDELIYSLVERGYERKPLAEVSGQFSVRGGIIDIFPPGCRDPLRIEFLADNLESLRAYDHVSQRSKESLNGISILPARELLLTPSIFTKGKEHLVSVLETLPGKMEGRKNDPARSFLQEELCRRIDMLSEPNGLDRFPGFLPLFYGEGGSIFDYLPHNFLVVGDEPGDLMKRGGSLRQELLDCLDSRFNVGNLCRPTVEPLWSAEELFSRLNCPLVGASLFPNGSGLLGMRESYHIATRQVPSYYGQWETFRNDYALWKKEGYVVKVVAASEDRGRRLGEIIFDGPPEISVQTGSMEKGFIIPGLKMVLVGEHDLLPRRRKKKRLKAAEGIRLRDYRELSEGDYVVHEQHGIGQYRGLSTLEVGNVKRDYLLLKYRGTDRLYIPVEQATLIQKYAGGESPAPRLHSLGGGEWQRLKKKVTRSVEELARELLALYAARLSVRGYSFGPDHPWQQEFEAQFPFEETPDQLKAIDEVKADLEKPHPMDRLICGDVGYGKTEVAMRAAFKAVIEGKQVVMLVPTTVLAQQHYRTFCERFSGFPVSIAQLSRLIDPARQKEVVAALGSGKIDIVIGTHRLLSKEIIFHDLGLLVIDEEQRFGVRQKEKIKQLRLDVDTLAMTATPIPRTLHLSLSGARDMSIIDTPPEDRYPVQTYVQEYSENLAREAIIRELNRQGQVYIVFNRIDKIDAYAEKIKRAFPEASVAVGHGQLPEKQLAKIMADFQEGHYQILVATTIIESGLDIPNVNTLIVCDADRFGLSQLYQIRGRVGRSNRLAYAYLTYRKNKNILEPARKRLQAIKEFTELGSGFKIALRDLEIRGAGNILGAEQHGHIAAVGFDLYMKMLDQAVAELKKSRAKEKRSSRIELQVSAYLPAEYIEVQDQKIELYQRIYNAASEEELSELAEELRDRYGPPPGPVYKLFQVARIKMLAAARGIELIRQNKENLVIQFDPAVVIDKASLEEIITAGEEKIRLVSLKPLSFMFRETERGEKLLEKVQTIICRFYPLEGEAAGSREVL